MKKLTRPCEEPIAWHLEEEPMRYHKVSVHPAHFEYHNTVLLPLMYKIANWKRPIFGYE